VPSKSLMPHSDKTWKPIGIVAIVVVSVGVLGSIPFIASRVSISRQEVVYRGVVVQKTARVTQSKYGAQKNFVLIVRTDEGVERAVIVPAPLHRQAVVGSRVRKSQGQEFPELITGTHE
jgi:hypothetical protein